MGEEFWLKSGAGLPSRAGTLRISRWPGKAQTFLRGVGCVAGREVVSCFYARSSPGGIPGCLPRLYGSPLLDHIRTQPAPMLDSVTTSIEAQSEHRTAALNAEIRRLKAMLDNLLDPQVLVQPERDEAGRVVDFILVYANRAACEWLRVDAEHVHAARVREILPGIEATNLMSLLIDTADTGPTRTIDAFECPRDSGSRWIDVRAVRVDEQISLAWRDVTEQRTATEKLAASEAKFRLLAENSSDVVMRMNMEGRITWVSPSLTPAIGW